MKFSKKNKKTLIWIGVILLILLVLYIFNSYFLRENFYATPTSQEDCNNNGLIFSGKKCIPPKSQEDCNNNGLIFNEKKCIPPKSQDDCTINAYGSIYDAKKKNCLGKITNDTCWKAYNQHTIKYKDKKLCDNTAFVGKANPDCKKDCKKYDKICTSNIGSSIPVTNFLNSRSCRKPVNQKDCDNYFKGKFYSSGSCITQIPNAPGANCQTDDDCSFAKTKCIPFSSQNQYAKVCEKSDIGQKCSIDDHCKKKNCVDGLCALSGVNKHCDNNDDCITKNCDTDNNICQPGYSMAYTGNDAGKKWPCKESTDCLSKNCVNIDSSSGFGYCAGQGKKVTEVCTSNDDCFNGNCNIVNNVLQCAPAKDYFKCKVNEDCESGNCDGISPSPYDKSIMIGTCKYKPPPPPIQPSIQQTSQDDIDDHNKRVAACKKKKDACNSKAKTDSGKKKCDREYTVCSK